MHIKKLKVIFKELGRARYFLVCYVKPSIFHTVSASFFSPEGGAEAHLS